MKKLYVLIGLILLAQVCVACSCITKSLENKYKESSRVAVVKVIKINYDPKNDALLLLKVETINQLKGKKSTKYKTDAIIYKNTTKDGVTGRYDCVFDIKVGSTWILFASQKDGLPYFDYCSQSTDNKQRISKIIAEIKNFTT